METQKHISDNPQPNGETFMLSDEPVDILVVENNDSERASIMESLQASIHDVHVVAVHDGIEALDFLFARGAWADREGEDPPKLVLLDLALPGSDGFSILGQIRSLEPQDALTLIPVVIFTDSHAAEDISKSYRCGANSYIMKPLSFPDFQAVVRTVGQYWMMHNKTPC
jgi:two-component system response regulator